MKLPILNVVIIKCPERLLNDDRLVWVHIVSSGGSWFELDSDGDCWIVVVCDLEGSDEVWGRGGGSGAEGFWDDGCWKGL